MKARYFLIGLFFLTFVAFTSTVRAADYKVGFEEDDEFIWICNSVNEDAMEDIFGKEWDESGFKKCCLEILPRKVITNESYYRSLAPVLSAFINFTEKEGLKD